ncbi:YolD-like family protein [Oceanobacillus profundus]|uniref:YolD-like family protein n=1 Tax=Oceanobacillus profundus TaxID=372463 RepID=UPI00203BAEB2|nr:YolD-like family protein [Oceanobacillus profundus]MCM3396501.1 YolD-like family protein [Oceanobacillus profundus]
MINDRGTKKWTALMMPEHIEMLNQVWKELDHKEKPILDEQQMEENAMKLQLAIHDSLTVEVKYFNEHDFHTVRGKLLSVINNDCLMFNDEDRTRVKFSDVIDVFVD